MRVISFIITILCLYYGVILCLDWSQKPGAYPLWLILAAGVLLFGSLTFPEFAGAIGESLVNPMYKLWFTLSAISAVLAVLTYRPSPPPQVTYVESQQAYTPPPPPPPRRVSKPPVSKPAVSQPTPATASPDVAQSPKKRPIFSARISIPRPPARLTKSGAIEFIYCDEEIMQISTMPTVKEAPVEVKNSTTDSIRVFMVKDGHPLPDGRVVISPGVSTQIYIHPLETWVIEGAGGECFSGFYLGAERDAEHAKLPRIVEAK